MCMCVWGEGYVAQARCAPRSSLSLQSLCLTPQPYCLKSASILLQVEMLIESYYLQLDDAYNRLKVRHPRGVAPVKNPPYQSHLPLHPIQIPLFLT